MSTGFNLGPITIHYYGIVIIMGISVAMILVSREAARRNTKLDFLLEALPWIFVGGVIGGATCRVIAYPSLVVA